MVFFIKGSNQFLITGLFKPPVNWVEGKQGKMHAQAQRAGKILSAEKLTSG
tara:strand:- start:52 stop:204 length:153 start_codon:yes stop_codon:yes gene_type:complete